MDWDTIIKHNTWEPLENLAGCEDMIADFNEREKQRLAELDAAATAKRAEQQSAAAKLAAEEAPAHPRPDRHHCKTLLANWLLTTAVGELTGTRLLVIF